MSNKSGTGLSDALDLDQAADDLNSASFSARAADAGENQEPDLFGDAADNFEGIGVFGTPNGSTAGRPKGARGKKTADLVRLIEATGRNPLLAMAEIVATPIPAIAIQLRCTMLEAANYHRQVMHDLAPYIASKQPIAIAAVGANAGKLTVIDFAGIAAAAAEGSEFGLDMKVVPDEKETVQNQSVIDHEPSQSHNDQSHELDK